MTLPSTPLQSKFGRRLLLLFVGCAVLPIALLAVVSYRHVERQLLLQTEMRLSLASKGIGLALLDRLIQVHATLRSVPPRAIEQLGAPPRMPSPVPPPPAASGVDGRIALGGVAALPAGPPKLVSSRSTQEMSRLLNAGIDFLAQRRLSALEFVADGGRRTAVFGRLAASVRIPRETRALLRGGRPVLITEHRAGSPIRIYMLRRLERGAMQGTLVGEIDPDYLWATVDQSLPSPVAQLRVIDVSGNVLYRASAAEAPDTEQPVVSAGWPILLDETFGASSWLLELSEPRSEVLAPMREFTTTFLIVVVLSILAILLLSFRQIRRSLLPLRALQEGTRSIAQRDFSGRVRVASRDEFEELAASFNRMALQLGRQFHALETAAEIDRAVLSATDASVIADTVLGRVGDVFPCRAVSVTLVAHDGGKSPLTLVHDREADARRTVRVDLTSADVQALLTGPELLRRDCVGERPGYLDPVAALGTRHAVVLPLRYQEQLVGVLALGERDDNPPGEGDLVQARRLADQVAVALANARMLEQVRLLAYYDSLTGLPNRLSYKERLAAALDQAGRNGRFVAVFFVDLDHFSRINDTLGHEAGDQLLQQVAVRIRACCREREDDVGQVTADSFPEVARLGGDEFTVLMPALGDPGHAAKLARRILSALAQPIHLGEREVFVNASIGIAIYPFDGEDLDTLLMHADTAMYKAKELGGNSYQTYSHSMTVNALQRFTLENDLRRALDREEFELHFQAIMSARSGQLVAAEVLLRWRHPEHGLLLPSEFIPLAEENGLILPIGEWVLRSACLQNRAWQDAGLPPIRVDVNLSSRQLRRALAETIGRILDEVGLESRFLGLELTESMLVSHQKEIVELLHSLRAMGLHVSVDDFGTGYSSFGYLKHFPVDTLKIDRAFVRGIAGDRDDAAITTAIIAMGHALGLGVIAEGVELEEQLTLLRRQGCDEVQGYLFGRPVPATAFAEHLVRQGPVSRRLSAIGSSQPMIS